MLFRSGKSYLAGCIANALMEKEIPVRMTNFALILNDLAANGKSYQNYAAALRIWAGNDKKKAPKKGIPDYSCKEGESL